MPFDKLVDSAKLDGALKSTADAIRAKTGGTENIPWSETEGFKSAVEGITAGGGGSGGPLQAKTAWPSHDEQVIAPDEDYYGLVSVKVMPVPRIPACEVSLVTRFEHPNTVEQVINIHPETSVIGEEVTFFWQVNTVDGASYGFSKASDGYYTSENRAKSDSYAICRIDFIAREEKTITLNCINYADEYCDYGLVSELDTMLSLSQYADSSGVLKNFRYDNSTSVVPLSFTIPAGEHFICVKFIKDSSGNRYNDAFKFTIVE